MSECYKLNRLKNIKRLLVPELGTCGKRILTLFLETLKNRKQKKVINTMDGESSIAELVTFATLSLPSNTQRTSDEVISLDCLIPNPEEACCVEFCLIDAFIGHEVRIKTIKIPTIRKMKANELLFMISKLLIKANLHKFTTIRNTIAFECKIL